MTPVAAVDRASIMGETARSSGQTDDIPRGSISLILTEGGDVQLRQSDNGETQSDRFEVVEWP